MMNKRFLALTILIAGLAVTACRRNADTAVQGETPTLDVTNWTEKTELFMEYPPLVTGEPALFAVHLTRMADFKPLSEGRPSVEFVPQAGGDPIVQRGSPPSRPGAFRIEAMPPTPGRYKWAILVDAPGFSDRHDLGTITVFADAKAGAADAEKGAAEDATAFAYLKEQQWTNEFATGLVREAELRTPIRVPGVIEPLTGGEAVVAAPAPGRFAADSLPSIGDRVKAGQVLGRLEPRLAGSDDRAALAAALAEARAQVEASRAELTRAERLLADRAVPARRVEEARRALTVAEARQAAAEARLAQRDETLRSGGGVAAGNAFVLRAPIAGRVAEIQATLGASYDEGAMLFKIVRTDRVEVQAHVSPADAPGIRDITSLAVEIPGRPVPIPLEAHHMHDSGVLDPRTRALPVQFEVDNPGGQLVIGQAATVLLYRRDLQRLPAVPKDAVLMEAGRPYVFVQVGGERFTRRPIEIALRDGDLVGVRSGLKLGERVVTRGAYDVQLASAARGLPAEGHVH